MKMRKCSLQIMQVKLTAWQLQGRVIYSCVKNNSHLSHLHSWKSIVLLLSYINCLNSFHVSVRLLGKIMRAEVSISI